ncbi:MAG: lysylphosphatidylglycerol synthase domain-containing protein [Planctomycetota bacterium]
MSVWKFLLRLAAGVALVGFLLHKHGVELRGVLERMVELPPLILLSAIALDLAGRLLSAYRWSRLAALAGKPIGFGRVAQLYYSGMFFNLCLPTSIGGDVFRVVGLGRNTGSKSVAFASVFMDRNIGMAALLTLGTAASLLAPTASIQATLHFLRDEPLIVPLWPLFILLGCGYVLANVVAMVYATMRCLQKRKAGVPWKGILMTSEFAFTAVTVLMNFFESLTKIPSLPPHTLASISGVVVALGALLHTLSSTKNALPTVETIIDNLAKNNPANAVPDKVLREITTPHAAHPGCFATAALLACVPLLAWRLTTPELFVAAVTGSTGSGRKPGEGTHHPLRHSDLYAYNVLAHRHAPEIKACALAATGVEAQVAFVPHSGPFARGIHATVQATLQTPRDSAQILGALREYYADSPFVRVSDAPPRVKEVASSNYARLSAVSDGRTVAVMCAIDNLNKGAAGGAVQWMNRLYGLAQTAGLTAPAPGWT